MVIVLLQQKDTNYSQRKKCIGQSLEGSKHKGFMVYYPPGIDRWHCTQCCQLGKFIGAFMSRVFIGVSLCKYDLLNHCSRAKLNLQPPPLPRGGMICGSKLHSLYHMVGLYSETCPHHESPCYHKLSMDHSQSPCCLVRLRAYHE